MVPMHQLRRNPHFAPLFAYVHPVCWPILWWSLNRLFKWYDTAGYDSLLFATTRWGYVYIAYLGDRTPDPSAYRARKPDHPRWDDPFWETCRPASVHALIPAPAPLAQARQCGHALYAMAERAWALPLPDTS